MGFRDEDALTKEVNGVFILFLNSGLKKKDAVGFHKFLTILYLKSLFFREKFRKIRQWSVRLMPCKNRTTLIVQLL